MIDQQFKIQPVAAFYKLLGKNFLLILGLSTVLSLLLFFILKFTVSSVLGSEGIKEMFGLFGAQLTNQSDMVKQSEAMRSFLMKHPGLLPFFLLSIVLGLLSSAYVFAIVQKVVKMQVSGVSESFIETLRPDKTFLKILLFLTLVSGFLGFASSFVFIGYAINPVFGFLFLVFLFMLIIRVALFFPGVVIGELNFMEAIHYSRETISPGKSFKIMVFGIVVFFMLSFILSALIYFPLTLLKSDSAKIYFNILVTFVQIGFISVGLSALFLRYGNFEEVKMAE